MEFFVQFNKWIIMPNPIHGIIIINKINAAKQINKLQPSKNQLIWQRNDAEHIIRNDNELNRIR